MLLASITWDGWDRDQEIGQSMQPATARYQGEAGSQSKAQRGTGIRPSTAGIPHDVCGRLATARSTPGARRQVYSLNVPKPS